MINSTTVPAEAEADISRARGRKVLWLYLLIFVVVSLPFSLVHLAASPDDAQITPVQRLGAAAANCSGPWGVLVVRLVDFPNAGLRAFRWSLAIGMTVIGGVLIGLPLWLSPRALQMLCVCGWAVFTIAWFLLGLTQIASGLL